DKIPTMQNPDFQVSRSQALALLAGLGGDAKAGVTKDEAKKFADQSVALLAELVKSGWSSPTELKEPDFDAVRGPADFQKLVAEVERRAWKGPETGLPAPQKKWSAGSSGGGDGGRSRGADRTPDRVEARTGPGPEVPDQGTPVPLATHPGDSVSAQEGV